MILKFDRWPWKKIGHLFYATSSFVHHFVAIDEFKLELQSGNANLGQNRGFLEPSDLEIWWMTLKNNRASLLSNIKLCASFHYHMWIQTGVTVRKQLSWVLTSVTLTFDLWPWPFAWTSLLSLVITPENFMIRWWEHSQKGVTDRQTDGRTDGKYHSLSCLVAAKKYLRRGTTTATSLVWDSFPSPRAVMFMGHWEGGCLEPWKDPLHCPLKVTHWTLLMA